MQWLGGVVVVIVREFIEVKNKTTQGLAHAHARTQTRADSHTNTHPPTTLF